MTNHPLISAPDLARLLAGPDRPVLLDVRWSLTGPSGRGAYQAGHIDGAVYVDLDTELAAPVGPGTGRHPLPAIEALQAAARSWGVQDGRQVVAYDAVGGTSAARAWWLLRWGGLDTVQVLDGGLDAWVAAGGPLSTIEPVTRPGTVTLTAGALAVLDSERAAEWATAGRLLDARSGERFRGEVEPVDAVAGHIPGAVSAPTAANLDPDAHFLDEAALRARFTALGITVDAPPVGVYCGSGVTAAHEILALAVIGVDAALYPGSWSEWISDPARPIATGD